MRPPIFIRPLTPDEQQTLTAALRSADAVVVRRAQILLASARGERAPQIASHLGCNDQTVRNVLQAFNAHGLAALPRGSSRPKTPAVAFDPLTAERLRALLHQSPRAFWQADQSLDLRPRGRHQFRARLDPTARQPRNHSGDPAPVRRALAARQALDHQPRPPVRPKKGQRDRLIRLAASQPRWALGFVDEVWWSRVAHPAAHAWTADQPLRLIEQIPSKDDPDPKALACYGVLLPGLARVWVRFVDGRPVSSLTTQFLAWVCEQLAALGKTAWLLIWDNASWPVSREVQSWIQQHNQRVEREGGVRIIACRLPVKSPWLNPIEAHWVHGKRRVVEPARLLTADELAERVCAAYGCVHEAHLSIPE